MFDWLSISFFSQENLQVLGFGVLIFMVFWIFRKIFTKYIFKLILRLTRKSKFDLDTSIVLAFERPLRTFFMIVGFFAALNYVLLELTMNPALAQSMRDSLFTFFRASIIMMIAWGLYNLSGESSSWIKSIGGKLGYELDQILLPFISKAIRFVIIALAFGITATELGYDVNGFVAGLGLGGLAFALAAQDTVKNIFGGVVILTEKPFTIGDWIATPSVEGTVEELTFRSTKIRTFAQSLVTVPNSTLANEAITNWSEMGRRRISYQLRVPFSTPQDKLKRSVDTIRTMLQNHEAIDQQTLFVHVDKFSEDSIEIMLYFFTKTTVWGEWLEIKEETNLKILEILENEGVSLAIPRRAIYVENSEQTFPKREKSEG